MARLHEQRGCSVEPECGKNHVEAGSLAVADASQGAAAFPGYPLLKAAASYSPSGPAGDDSASTSDPAVPPHWVEAQIALAQRVRCEEIGVPAGAPDLLRSLGQVSRVGGVDLSFVPDQSVAVAALVVLSFPGLDVLYEDLLRVDLAGVPYVPGYLGFREVPPLVHLLDRLRATRPALAPDVVFVDGNGILHPRRCGSASHLGVIACVPTVGCSKTLFCMPSLRAVPLADACATPPEDAGLAKAARAVQAAVAAVVHPAAGGRGAGVGAAAPAGLALLADSGGCLLGASLSLPAAPNPIFVSPGHLVTLPFSVACVEACRRYRVPEPIREADIRSRSVCRDPARLAALPWWPG